MSLHWIGQPDVSAGRDFESPGIAIVRRLLLDLKVPDGQDPVRLLGQPVEVWVSQPVEDFDGWTPAQVLATPTGDDTVLSWLETRRR